MSWFRKPKEETKKQETPKQDPRIQQYRNTEDRIKAEVEKPKPPEPMPEPEPEDPPILEDNKLYPVQVLLPGVMLKRMEKLGESRGYLDPGEVVRDAIRRLW